MSVEILLNEAWTNYALQAAVGRLENSARAGYKHKYAIKGQNKEDILRACWLAACSELVAAQWLKVPDFKLSIDTYKTEPDIPPDWEVKHTEYDNGHLIIQDNDRDGDRAILVTGINPFVIRGWLPIKFCKDDLYLKSTASTGNLAYWVPQTELVKVYEPVAQT